jgi:hypothetical protein
MLDPIKQKEAIPERRLRLDTRTKQYVEHQNRELFIKGPIPLPWLSAAAALPGKTLNVAMVIFWLAGMSKHKEFQITGASLRHLAISEDAFRDGLKRLEKAGLIRVNQVPGRRPRVTVL